MSDKERKLAIRDLFKKHKNNKEAFLSEYATLFPSSKNKHSITSSTNIDDPAKVLTDLLSEEISISIDSRILGEISYMGFLQEREKKLKRILGL